MFLSVSELSPLSEKMEKPQQKRTEFSPVQIQRLEEEFEKKKLSDTIRNGGPCT